MGDARSNAYHRCIHSTTVMSLLAVHIKHAGKVYDIQLDPGLPPSVFKDAIYHATGVPPDRMKVMVKGGFLKVGISEGMKAQTSFELMF